MPDDSLLLAADSEVVRMALDGLTSSPKTLPPQLFYDPAGCDLFYQVTRLPEYYLTRTEMALLPRVAADLVSVVRPPAVLVEYGASDEAKARTLLALRDQGNRAVFAAYVPVDIAADSIDAMTRRLRLAGLPQVYPVIADFTRPLTLPRAVNDLRPFGFFPGSTIGNLDPDAARRFLAQARITLGGNSFFLVGADLRKDPARLIAAYRRFSGHHRRFQPQPPGPPEPRGGRNFRSHPVCPPCHLERWARPDRNASGERTGSDGARGRAANSVRAR